MRILSCLASLLIISSAPVAQAAPYDTNTAAIVYVDCGIGMGTAVKIGENEYVTAAHVVSGNSCRIDGQEITNVRVKSEQDFARFTGPSSPHTIRVSCENYNEREVYMAVGYGHALREQMWQGWQATAVVRDGFRLFIGEGIPGQSGGAMLNRRGEIVGVVNMRWPARSLPLASTDLC